MQFFMMIKHAENPGTPPQSLFDAMGTFIQRSFESGALVSTAGLMPTSSGHEVRLRKGRLTVVDGPFTEAKEVVGGYAVINADSDAQALEVAREFMQLHLDHWPEFEGTCEVRGIEEMPQPE